LIGFGGMPTYFFHVRTENAYSKDTLGADFPDDEAAKREAVTAAREMIADMVLNGDSFADMRFEVTDEIGDIVLILPFRFLIGPASR
jgi:hypothetical protein